MTPQDQSNQIAEDTARRVAANPDLGVELLIARASIDLARQLRVLRYDKGLSQKEVAKRANTSQPVVARYESPGYSGHTLRNLVRHAHAIDATIVITIEQTP